MQHQLKVNWHSIDSSLAFNCLIIGIGIVIDRIHLTTGPSGVSLYRGKRPRSLPWDRFCTIETGSHRMTLQLKVNCYSIVNQLTLHWHSIVLSLALGFSLTEFISLPAPRVFPFIEANDRGACFERDSVL